MTEEDKSRIKDAAMDMVGKEIKYRGVERDDKDKPIIDGLLKTGTDEADRHFKSIQYTSEEYSQLVEDLEQEIRVFVKTY